MLTTRRRLASTSSLFALGPPLAQPNGLEVPPQLVDRQVRILFDLLDLLDRVAHVTVEHLDLLGRHVQLALSALGAVRVGGRVTQHRPQLANRYAVLALDVTQLVL